ncbi:three component ABC system middle component [Leeuwenhoekiella sp. H156]|uniref:three component ABC system middle component n=1 Tax=Leeuwenhoekiella sp. H156 TaxID=3450128 RepID=UPI003FA46055
MNKKLDLFDVLQNTTVGVIAIQSFVLGYNAVSKGKKSEVIDPHLYHLFYVLPIVLEKSSVETFKSSMELYTAISKDKNLTLGLQNTANKMTGQTFDSLNLGFSKGIFTLDKGSMRIGLTDEFKKVSILRKMKISDPYFKNIRNAAFRLGNIFAKKDEKMLQLTLNIRF